MRAAFLLLSMAVCTDIWAQKVDALDTVRVRTGLQTFGITRLKDVDGAGIYAGKKSEVIILKDINANTATNNSRQIYSKVAGLNIYENDGGAGIQLAIGGRGLDPNRVSNFNTRQNGYDISADALGYPESYYTPPAEMTERIEIVRGASSLQYGTQFGGILNFRLNRGPDTARFQVTARESAGSFGFFNTSTSVGGNEGSWKYYAFFQHKSGNGWRAHSGFNANTGYVSATKHIGSRLSITAEYTHEDYLEQQAGGLTDAMFAANARMSTKARNWFKVNWNLGAVLLDYAISSRLQLNSRLFGLSADRSALGIINTVTDPGGPRQYRTDSYANWGNETRLIYNYGSGARNGGMRNGSVARDGGGLSGTLLVGARYYHGYTDRKIGNSNDGTAGAKSDFSYSFSDVVDSLTYSRYKFPNHNIAGFAENIFRVTKKFSIIPGLRYENIVTKSDGSYNNYLQDHAGNIIYTQPVAENRTNTRSFLIGGLGVSYTQSADLQGYANISQNYRAINFNDMSIVNPNFRVDPNLKDEKGYSADIGVRGRYHNIFNYDLSFFYINYNNRIGTILQKDTTSPNTYQYTTNIAHSRNWGVESFVEVDIWKLLEGSGSRMKLSVFSNLSLIDARYVNSKESAYENKKVEFVPSVIGRWGVNFRLGPVGATWQYSYTSMQYSDATNSPTPSNNGINGPVPAYSVMDFTADWRINRIFTLQASVNNLSNRAYFTRRADSYPGPGIVPADGRSWYATLQIAL
ncbi:TonB-dependent receptor family protein [Puia sp.]|uniref:TonB-dependent receptor family protein n=1 Tax=Puia sp. TaxID=2045100 RepID=UPI002F3E36B0